MCLNFSLVLLLYLPFKMKKNDLLLDCHMRFRVTGISELQAPFGPKPHLDKRGLLYYI